MAARWPWASGRAQRRSAEAQLHAKEWLVACDPGGPCADRSAAHREVEAKCVAVVPHAMWKISGEPARILEVVAPGGIERYFEQIAPILTEQGLDWTKRYYALAEEYGLEILDDWSNELKARYGITL